MIIATVLKNFKCNKGINVVPSSKESLNSLTQLLPFELFSKKFCLNISELGFAIIVVR